MTWRKKMSVAQQDRQCAGVWCFIEFMKRTIEIKDRSSTKGDVTWTTACRTWHANFCSSRKTSYFFGFRWGPTFQIRTICLVLMLPTGAQTGTKLIPCWWKWPGDEPPSLNNWAFWRCPLQSQSQHFRLLLMNLFPCGMFQLATAFPACRCFCPNFFEICWGYEIQRKHIFLQIPIKLIRWNTECFVFVLFLIACLSKRINKWTHSFSFMFYNEFLLSDLSS